MTRKSLSSPYEQVKELNDFHFNYFPFKSEKRDYISFQYTLIIQIMTPVSIRPFYTELNTFWRYSIYR